MTITWNSLHLSYSDSIADHARTLLTAQGYVPFDPFGSVPGRAYPQSVRAFAGPPSLGWTRLIGAVTPTGTLEDVFLPGLSSLGTLIALTLDDETARIQVAHGGEIVDPLPALTPHLRPGRTEDDLRAALTGDLPSAAAGDDSPIPLDMLPDDVQAMARDLNPKHINSLFNKIMGRFGKRTAQEADAARGLLAGLRPNWASDGGRRIRMVTACLTLPDDWHTPDFVTLRDAYQLHRRLERRPNATRYPGDDDALQAVPDALAYTPIYGGKPA